MKTRLVGAEMFHADWQADMTKLTVAFRSCVNASKDAMAGMPFMNCIASPPPLWRIGSILEEKLQNKALLHD